MAKIRSIRFHDLRHTTASLLMMAGASPVAVQRILRHADIKTTTETYTHLSKGWLHSEIDRLALLPAGFATGGTDTEPRRLEEKNDANLVSLSGAFGNADVPNPSQNVEDAVFWSGTAEKEFNDSNGMEWCAVRDSNPRPSASETDALSS